MRPDHKDQKKKKNIKYIKILFVNKAEDAILVCTYFIQNQQSQGQYILTDITSTWKVSIIYFHSFSYTDPQKKISSGLFT